MPSMVLASKGRNVFLTRLAFQRFVSWSMRVETIGSLKSRGGLIALYVVGVGSHFSSHMWIFLPLPTCHLVPWQITSRLQWMLRQAYDGLHPNWALRTSKYGKYLALYILEINESNLVSSLQACLASMAKLKAWRF